MRTDVTARKRYDHVLAAALDHPWAITPPMLSVVAGVIARHVAGAPRAADPAFIPREPATSATTGGIAILPIHGVLAPRMNLMSDFSGGTTFDELTMQLREAVAARDVGTIVFDIDSPGGSVAGATEFAAEVLQARTVKPVYAVANFEMCSAAYWVGACASRIIAAPSALVGSIGVYTIHEDLSAALEQLGVKVTYIAAGKYKVDGNDTEPLSDTARARLKAIVGSAYDHFTEDVAAGRAIPSATIRGGYGEGAVVTAAEALSLGMVDEIATLDQTIATLLAPSVTARARALDTAQRERAAFELQLM